MIGIHTGTVFETGYRVESTESIKNPVIESSYNNTSKRIPLSIILRVPYTCTHTVRTLFLSALSLARVATRGFCE